MNKKKKDPRKGKLARRTLIRVLLLTWILITGIGYSIGRTIHNENRKNYLSFSQSYVRLLVNNIDGDRIPGYLSTGAADDYYWSIFQSMQAMVDVAGLRYLYVFVPEEEGIRYVWDAQSDDDERPLNDIWYYEGTFSPDLVFDCYRNGKEASYIYRYDVIDLAAYIVPIRDSDGNVVALAEADVIVPRVEMIFSTVVRKLLIYVIAVLLIGMGLHYYETRKRIITPLEKLDHATAEMIGNLDSTEDLVIDIHTGDEIEIVARSIEELDRKLKDYIRENLAITAERERIGAEMDMAANIQTSMLPNLFPAYPQREEFDIYATMEPAKEVGGDFYDFYMIGENRLALVVADVSGKGVPAALYMMISKMLLKTQMQSEPDPATALRKVNTRLYENNDESMFVTVWLGILDLTTGELTYADAGHEKIVLYQNGEWRMLPKEYRGMVLGMVATDEIEALPEKRRYRDQTILMKPGDLLLQYTDGVTEATDDHEEMFGEARLVDAVKSSSSTQPEELLPHIRGKIADFVGDAEAFDDITMLALRYNGR